MTFLFIDPFLLFRALVTIVLGAIWLYTFIEAVGMLVAFLSRSKRQEKITRDARQAVLEAESVAGHLPPSLVQRLKSSQERLGAERAIRISKKLALLKVMNFFSMRTIRFVWRELVVIGVLLVLIGLLLYYYYTLAL